MFAASFRSVMLRGCVLAALSLSTLSGCGWRLQGTAPLPQVMSITYIEASDRYSDFTRALKDGLAASGARITADRRDATAIVQILKDETGQRVLSVSASNSPEEYEVFYKIEYSVVGSTGELIPAQKLEVSRDYSYDETLVLAKQREQATLREALARDLAGLVIRQVASL